MVGAWGPQAPENPFLVGLVWQLGCHTSPTWEIRRGEAPPTPLFPIKSIGLNTLVSGRYSQSMFVRVTKRYVALNTPCATEQYCECAGRGGRTSLQSSKQ